MIKQQQKINGGRMKLENDLPSLEQEAIDLQMPIIQKEALEYMVELLNKEQLTNILEIGSCIGYSSILLASNVKEGYVETIEIDHKRFLTAVENIKKYQLENNIYIHHGDALSFDECLLKKKQFDCLFIDAAKAQYQKFFEKYIKYVNQNGIVIVDNLDFHGMIFHIDEIKNRNTRQLVRKIKQFKDWIFNHEDFECHYVHVGDGLAIIRRKLF